MKKYNVYIKEIKTGKIIETIGKDMSEERAEKRELSGIMRIDRNNYFVSVEKVKEYYTKNNV